MTLPDAARPVARAPDCRVVSVFNQKGGVGKTTTAINLAAALVASGRTVCLIDLDPQGNASTGLGIDRAQRGDGSYGLITGQRGYNAVRRATGISGLSLIAAEPGLAGAEIELVTAERREYRLLDSLQTVGRTAQPTDFIVIDCPPGLNLLSLNALVASHTVVVPLQCEFLALEGLSQVTATIGQVGRSLNQELHLHGILLTMSDRRNNLSELVEADVRGFFGDKVYTTVIPRNVRISEAPSHGRSVLDYDARSSGAVAYIAFCTEFLARDAVLQAEPINDRTAA